MDGWSVGQLDGCNSWPKATMLVYIFEDTKNNDDDDGAFASDE